MNGKYTGRIDELRELLLGIYDPATALTDPEVARINRELLSIADEMDGKEECHACQGWGEAKDDEGWLINCRECDGTGLVHCHATHA